MARNFARAEAAQVRHGSLARIITAPAAAVKAAHVRIRIDRLIGSLSRIRALSLPCRRGTAATSACVYDAAMRKHADSFACRIVAAP